MSKNNEHPQEKGEITCRNPSTGNTKHVCTKAVLTMHELDAAGITNTRSLWL